MNVLNVNSVFELSHTGQVASMEHLLNTRQGIVYEMASRDADIALGSIIYIDDELEHEQVVFYNHHENRPKTYLYNKTEAALASVLLYNYSDTYNVDFAVRVPSGLPSASLTYNEVNLRAQVLKYKQAGPRFAITYY